MNCYLPNKASSLFFEFKREGEFVIPDTGSLTLTVRDGTGAVITGYNGVAQADCLVSTLVVVLPSEVNIITADFETRFVRLDFTSGGEPLFVEKTYRVSSFIPLLVSFSTVRSIFGAREQELPDADIDLPEAYFTLLEEYPTEMTGALAGATTSRSANRAVALRAALQLLPSMPNRILKEDSMNTASLIRGNTDWEALGAKIQEELGAAIANLKTIASGSAGALLNPVLMVSSPSVDPITYA